MVTPTATPRAPTESAGMPDEAVRGFVEAEQREERAINQVRSAAASPVPSPDREPGASGRRSRGPRAHCESSPRISQLAFDVETPAPSFLTRVSRARSILGATTARPPSEPRKAKRGDDDDAKGLLLEMEPSGSQRTPGIEEYTHPLWARVHLEAAMASPSRHHLDRSVCPFFLRSRRLAVQTGAVQKRTIQ